MRKGLILFSRRHKGIIMYATEGAFGGGQMFSAPNRKSPAAPATASENLEPPIPQTTCGPTVGTEFKRACIPLCGFSERPPATPRSPQKRTFPDLIHIFKIKFQDAAAYGFAPRRACPNAWGFRRTSGGTPSHGRDGNGAEIHLRAVSFKGFYLSTNPFYLKRLRAAASTIDAAPRIAAATCGSGTCVIPT